MPVLSQFTRARLSVSIRYDLAQWTRREARDRGMSVSAVVAEALTKMRAEEAERGDRR